MARASTPTQLPIDKAARLLGISPAHFNGAYAGDIAWTPCGNCAHFFYQWAWQCTTGLAREFFAQKIMEIEVGLEAMLDRPLTPTLKKKVFPYQDVAPQRLAHEYLGYWPDGAYSCVDAGYRLGIPSYYIGNHLIDYKAKKWNQLIVPDVRDANLVYCDLDNDTFAETATITFTTDHLVEAKHLGVFYAGHLGDSTWRIRPVRSISIEESDVDGVYDVSIAIDTYQLLDPALAEEPPRMTMTNPLVEGNLRGCSMVAIDMLADDVFVPSVVVGEEVDDIAFSPVKFSFGAAPGCGNTNCTVCNKQTYTGCLVDLTRSDGFVVVVPAAYDEDDGWCSTNLFGCCGRKPGTVEITYWDALPNYVESDLDGIEPPAVLSEIIAMIAAARIQLVNCECDCDKGSWWKELSVDLAITTGQGRYLDYGTLGNPFGTRRGEIQGWQRYLSYTYNRPIVKHGMR